MFSNYRIIKIKDICPWQVQKRVKLLAWENVSLGFSSLESAKKHKRFLEERDAFNRKQKIEKIIDIIAFKK